MAIRTLGRSKSLTALGLTAAAAAGFWLGRGGPQSTVYAAPPAAPAAPAAPASDYGVRVVAYIYGSTPITREDLGEYLIARKGLDHVELLVNKKIIELACEKRNISVTDAEVEASIMADCDTIGVKKGDFIQKVLKQYNKTMFEWKEDVIKPRLLLTKLVKDRIVKPTDEELRKAYDAAYGEKRECRIIIWPSGEERLALKEYDDVRKSEEGFSRKARSQANPALAATGGAIRPVARHSGVHPEVEKAAFTLQPGEVSSLIKTPEGTLVLKMDKVMPPDTSVKFEDKRAVLEKEVYDKKVATEIPVLFKTLRDEAKPTFILKKPTNDPETVKREAEELLQQTGGPGPAKP